MDNEEDIVRTDPVLVLVHQQEHRALQVDVEDDRPVEPGNLKQCQQIPATPEKSIDKSHSLD